MSQYTLVEICCNTDWKGRPDHKLKFVAFGTVKELIERRDKEARDIFIDGLIEDKRCDLENELDENDEQIWTDEGIDEELNRYKLALENWTTDKLKEEWTSDNVGDLCGQWEMNLTEPKDHERIFAWKIEGDFSSVSYRILEVPHGE